MKNTFSKDVGKYKLIVSDFDGTLAGPEHVVTPPVIEAVKMWIEKGKYFSIATGRQYLMIDDECKKMNLKHPVIVRGGAEVIDPVTDRILHSEYIDAKDVEMIIKMVTGSGLFYYNLEIDRDMYTNFTLALHFPKLKYRSLGEFKLQSVPKVHLKPIDPDASNAEEFVNKMVSHLPNVHAIATHNNKFGKGWDVTSVKATKLHGIVKVMEQLDLKREEIVGVGDSYNDFPLLQAAQLKVAMGNAHDELKEIADLIVPSHDEDGVAYLINTLLARN